jgi:isoquinoline 1-oxidoreductase beta subunit
VDFDTVGGTEDTPYSIPNFRVSAHHPKVSVPPSQWRAVGYTHNIFVMETLIDELATRAKADPIAYRLKLLNPEAHRLRAALALLDQKSDWRGSLPRGHTAGIACTQYQGTAVACAAEVSIENKRAKVRRVTVALHCGLAVNPLTIENQFQGGIVFGMTQLMPKGAITLKDGRVEQRNFHDLVPPYIGDAPAIIDVHIVPSTEAPTGCGEPPVPVISPAVVNALAKLTGKRYRTLPLTTL